MKIFINDKEIEVMGGSKIEIYFTEMGNVTVDGKRYDCEDLCLR